VQKILDYMPVTNLKQDTGHAEDKMKLLANYNSKKMYRQVGALLGRLVFAFVMWEQLGCMYPTSKRVLGIPAEDHASLVVNTDLTGVYQIWVSDSNVHCHHAACIGTSSWYILVPSSWYILVPPSCCLHWVCWQANRARGTDCVHPLRGGQRRKLLEILSHGVTPPVIIFVKQKKGADFPGEGFGGTWCQYTCHVTILMKDLPLKPLQ